MKFKVALFFLCHKRVCEVFRTEEQRNRESIDQGNIADDRVGVPLQWPRSSWQRRFTKRNTKAAQLSPVIPINSRNQSHYRIALRERESALVPCSPAIPPHTSMDILSFCARILHLVLQPLGTRGVRWGRKPCRITISKSATSPGANMLMQTPCRDNPRKDCRHCRC